MKERVTKCLDSCTSNNYKCSSDFKQRWLRRHMMIHVSYKVPRMVQCFVSIIATCSPSSHCSRCTCCISWCRTQYVVQDKELCSEQLSCWFCILEKQTEWLFVKWSVFRALEASWWTLPYWVQVLNFAEGEDFRVVLVAQL